MATYKLTLKNDDVFVIEAEFYQIYDGFLRLWHKEFGTSEEFQAYAVDCVRHITLQEKESTKEEI